MLKLVGAFTQSFAGTHVILEWLQGLFLGLSLALGMEMLVRHERVHANIATPRWTGVTSLLFVLCVIPYLNACRVPERWMRDGNFPEKVQGFHAVGGFEASRGWIGWVEALFVPLGIMMLLHLNRHAQRRLRFIPKSWLGRGQLLYLAFLWAIVFLSFTIEISGLQPTWFIIQWAITLHALVCTWLLLALPVDARTPAPADATNAWPIVRIAFAAVLIAAITVFAGWMLKQSLFGDTFAGYTNENHIRFGPHNTNDRK
jgi:hypothetical protein